MKKFMVFLLISVLLLNGMMFSTAAAVADNVIAVPCWTNVNQISYDITFENGIGTAVGSVFGKFGATNASVSVVVYVQTNTGWDYVGQANSNVVGRNASADYEFTPVLNATYKAEFSFSVIKSNNTETLTETVIETYTGG